MSGIYIGRIRSIEAEFIAARGSLAYVAESWYKQSLYSVGELESIGPNDVKNAADNLEATYIIRLFAEFEGMLRDHMAQHHPGLSVPKRTSRYVLNLARR